MLSALRRVAIITSILATSAIPAFAAVEDRGNPSEPIVWGFMAFCALIIIAQIAPLFRNLKKQSKVAAEQTKSVKQHL